MNLLPLTMLTVFPIHGVHSANILVILPFPLHSLTTNYMPIFRGLAARGHNVTLVSPFPQKEPVGNLTEIIFPNIGQKIRDYFSERDPIKYLRQPRLQMFSFWHMGLELIKTTLAEDLMKRLITDTSSKYDLIIAQIWHLQELNVAFGHKYNAPVIGIAARFITPLTAYLTGNHLPTSYVPVQTLTYTDRMSFIERAINLFHYSWYVVNGKLNYLREQEALMREHFKYPGSETLPPLTEMLSNVSLTLMDTSTTAVGYPTPLFKNIVEFGGIHVDKELQPLPTDLQQFMDNASDGVIYFSFGSVFILSEFDSSKVKAIISAFGKAKQKVLMKLEVQSPYFNTTTPNTLVRQWVPQLSILAHPNCKLFVTHCGLHSILEAIYYSVPMVAIPLVADQPFNGKLIETFGIGRTIMYEQLTEEGLLENINTVLNNVSYKENINKRSAILKDTPIDMLDNAIYWIEYVIRHKGAPHLRPAVLDLHWYQQLMLDVIVFYLLIITIIMYVIKTTITMFWRRIMSIVFRGKDSKQSKLKSKKE